MWLPQFAMNKPFSRDTKSGPVLLQVSGLTKRYTTAAETIDVLRDVSLDVRAGERVAIVGPSGSGKSTLLYILGLLLPPTAGSYRMQGEDMLALDRGKQAALRCRRFGFVLQSCNLIEHSTVWENLELPLMYAQVPVSERDERIRSALALVDLEHRIHHPTNRLSGGEQQRVAIARALANRPCVILADEPTGQLDHSHGQQIMDNFEAATCSGDTALLVVTHNPAVAERCTRVCRLEGGMLAAE